MDVVAGLVVLAEGEAVLTRVDDTTCANGGLVGLVMEVLIKDESDDNEAYDAGSAPRT